MPVPVWVIILAVLAGLLLLAVLVFVMHRVSNGLGRRGREEEAGQTGEGRARKKEELKRKKGRRKGIFDDDDDAW